MENDLSAQGAAVDLSWDMLKSCDYYKTVFNQSKTPIRICSDANHLPFKKDSIPFVFCYQTLHHFPDPTRIVAEIHRVLAPGGHFFFAEEPYRRFLHFSLFQGRKVYSPEALQASGLRKVLECFFAEKRCNEVEFGIVENEQISIRAWKQMLGIFEETKIKLCCLDYMGVELFNPQYTSPKYYLKLALTYLLGGSVTGTCRKAGDRNPPWLPIPEALACPSCLETGRESRLEPKELSYVCSKCGNILPMMDNILFLFSDQKFKELYPGIYQSWKK